MNKNFRSIWNDALGAWVAVSEIESAKGKPAASQVHTTGGYSAVLKSALRAIPLILGLGVGMMAGTAHAVTIACDTSTLGNINSNLVCGQGSTANTAQSLAVGNSTQAGGEQSVAAGFLANAAGNNTVAVGSYAQALSLNATSVGNKAGSSSSSEYDTSIGYSAGSNITPVQVNVGGGQMVSGRNTSVGADAGNNLQGSLNTVVGANTGRSIAGSGNTALGSNAAITVTGNWNTAVGYASGRTVSGSTNVALGQTAGNNVSSDFNIGIGAGAGANISGGHNTISIGSNTGQGVTGGSNYAIGTSSGRTVSGIRNLTFGYASGNNVTGSDNISLGTSAGLANRANNTVSIGNLANASANNSIALGNNALSSVQSSIAIGEAAQTASTANTSLDAAGSAIAPVYSIAIGTQAISENRYAVSLGYKANAMKDWGVALGSDSVSRGQDSVALGHSAAANNLGDIFIGYQTGNGNTVTAGEQSSVAIGYRAANNTSAASNMVAIGTQAATGMTGDYNVAIGGNAGSTVTGTGSIPARAPITNNYTTSVGARSYASGAYSSAFGTRAEATGSNAVAVGVGSKAVGASSVATGDSAQATAARAIAIGSNAQATGSQSISIGVGNVVSGANSGALGDPSYISGSGTYTIGNDNGTAAAPIAANNAGAFGNNNAMTAAASGSRIVGNSNNIQSANAMVMGNNVTVATGLDGAVVLGNDSAVSASTPTSSATVNGISYSGFAGSTPAAGGVVSVGSAAAPRQIQNVAAGRVTATSTDAINGSQLYVVAEKAQHHYFSVNSTLEGNRNNDGATGLNAIAIGLRAAAVGQDGLAVGVDTAASAQSSTALGTAAKATQTGATAVGNGAQANGESSLALGRSVTASGREAFAAGRSSSASGAGSLALGLRANAGQVDSIAMGTDATASVAQGVALGAGSVASVASGQEGVDPLGAGGAKNNTTWTANRGAVSVGNGVAATRQITSVAAGTADTDAVNVAQLKAAGFKLTASHVAGGESTTVADDNIQNGETLTVDAGKNIKVTHTANVVSIATKDNVEFTQITLGDAANNTVLTSTADGLDVGGDKITNVAAGTTDNDAVNKSQLDKAQAAATTKVEGTQGVTVTPTDNADGSKTYTVATKTDSNTITLNANGEITANTAPLTSNNGVASTTGNGTALVTAGDVINAVNSSGFTAKANGDAGQFIQSGNSVDFINGDNIEITRNGAEFTIATAKDVSFDSVTAGTGDSQVVIGSNGVQVGGNTYINNDGLNANDKVVSNVAAGNISVNSTDAVNGSQLFQAGANTAQYLGGGSTVDGNGNVTAPSYTLTSGNPADGNTTAYRNVGDALGALNTAVNQPLTFSGDNAAGNFNRQLGSQVNLRGGATGELSNNNIGVVANGTDTLNIQLAKELTDLTSAQFADAAGNSTTVGGNGINITPANGNPVSLSENGLNNGGNVISGVAEGQAGTDAVNVDQLNAVRDTASAGWNLTAQGQNSSNVGANETVDLNNSDNNIEISKTAGSNDVTFNLARNLNVDGVTAGSGDSQVVIGSNGVQVGGNTYINNDGLNANDKVVSNVAAGNISANSTDAVNGSQLFQAGANTAQYLGGGSTVDGNGNVTAPSYTLTSGNPADGSTTAYNNVGDALGALNTAVNQPLTFSGDNAAGNFNRQLGSQVNLRGGATGELSNNNIGVVANGTDTLNIQLAKELTDLTSAQFVDAAGNSTTVGGNGINITPANGNPVSLSENGLNNGGNVISGVAEGQAGTDAVNVDQLNAVRDTASAGWNLTAQGQNSSNVGANETVDLNNSDNNIEISKTAGSNDVTFNLARNLTVDGVTAGSGDSQVVIGSNGVQVGGNTYINNDGLNANDKVVSNVAAGNISANSTDAVNGSQLFQAGANTAQYLGGGSTVDGNGNVTAPSYTLTSGNPADGNTTAYRNVGDALGALNTAVNQPLTFSGDNAAGNFNRQLGSQVNLRGGAAGALSDSNIGVVANGTDTLNIQLAKELTDLTSAQFVDAAGNRTTVDSNGINITPANGNPVSLSENGLNNGGNVIAGVGAGQAGTDAVNVDQLNAAAAAATNKVAAGDNIEVAEVQNNDGSTTYTVATARNVNFDRVTAGSGDNQVVLNNSGVNVGGNTYISNDGLNANNRVIRNVAAGNVAAGSTDAVNGGQLHNTANSIANVFGGNAAVNPDGSVSMSNVGGTGANNVNDAIRAVNQAAVQAKTTVTAGDNIVVTPSTNADGSSNYTVATAKDLAVDSVTAGNTVINNGGITINNGAAGNPVSLGQNGLNNGGNTLTNVASGLQGKTVDQIRAEGSNSAQWNNAATVGDLTQVQGNVTNVNNTITNLSTTVGGADDNGNAYLSPNGELTDAGRLALKTYDVQGQTATDNNTVISAIKNMNEGGIKYFHTNDASGQKTGGAIADTHDSSASGAYATAIGYSATANAENAIALGRGAQALAENSISIGTGNIVRGNKSGAIGDPTIINGESSYSVGNDNRVDTNDTFVLGNNVTQTMNNSVILGSQSSATAVHTTAGGGNYTYAGANDDNVAGVNDVVGVVSVGTEGQTRQVQNVAAGVVSPTSTDAINGSQLYHTNQAINNIANHTVNIGNQLNQRIDEVGKKANAGVAGAIAQGSIPQVTRPGTVGLGIGSGFYGGQSAMALGVSSMSDNGNWIVKGNLSTNSGGHVGVGAGALYQW